jgi:hypothetical protein
MKEDTVVRLPRPGASVTDDPLLEVRRSGARRMLQQVVEGKNLRRVDTRHRQAPPPRQKETPVKPGVARRPLDFYGAVGQRLAAEAGR